MFQRLKALTFATILGGLAPQAYAAPYVMTYSGTTNNVAAVDGIAPNSAYTVSVVVDNGGSSAANQTWTPENVTCVRFNYGARQFSGLVNATAPLTEQTGSATTNGTGALTSFFTALTYESLTGVPVGTYAYNGALIPLEWYINDANDVFFFIGGSEVGDALGGVQIEAASWSAPQTFSGSCLAGGVAVSATTAVSTLNHWALLVMGLLTFAVAARRFKSKR